MRYIPAEALALSEHRGHAAPLPVLGGHAQSPESRLTETASLQAMLDTFAAYDTMRLTRFLGRGDPRRIDIRSRGRCQALRFDEVEYFNRIYHVDREAIAQLPDLLSGYRDLPHRVELVAAADTRLADFEEELAAHGLVRSRSYARCGLDLEGEREALTSEIHVRPFRPEDIDTFLDLYLGGFEAEPDNWSAAKKNMRLLFPSRDLYCCFALEGDQAASLGLLFRRGGHAYLCGGATLPQFRNKGYHQATIAYRLRLAEELGCESAITWAVEDSPSHRNMLSCSLRTVAVDATWRSRGRVQL